MKKYLLLIAAVGLVVPLFASASFTSPLSYGESSNDVIQLQDLLVTENCLSVQPTGYFGLLTLAGVKCFQAKFGIPQTGYFGTLSMAKANSIIATLTASSTAAQLAENGGATSGTNTGGGSSNASCPTGYTCTSNIPSSTTACPAGFSCTPSQLTSQLQNIINSILQNTGGSAFPAQATPSDTPVISSATISGNTITILWSSVNNAQAYIIQRSTNGTDFSPVLTVSSAVLFYPDSNTTPGTTYYYRVEAITTLSVSPWSNVMSAKIPVSVTTGGGSGTGGTTGGGSGGSSGGGTTTGAQPGANNTGPTGNPSTFTVHNGSMTITTANTALSNIEIDGTLYVEAPNVTITNFIINAEGNSYGIQVVNPSGGNSSVTATDGEVYNASQGGVFGNNWTANRLNIHDMGADGTDGGGNNLLENSWIHDISHTAGSHGDGFQSNNGHNIVIRNNNFAEDTTAKWVNSCIFLNEQLGNQDPADLYGTVIDHNWFSGSNYAVYAINQSNTSITNNVFGNFQYGHVYNPSGFPKPTYSGNTDTSRNAVNP